MRIFTDQEKKLAFYGFLFVGLYLYFFFFSLVVLRCLPFIRELYLVKMVAVEMGRWTPAVFLVLLGLVYYVVAKKFSSQHISRQSVPVVLFFAVIFHLLLLLSFPTLSADITGYIARSTIVTEHHQNPYRVTPDEVDPSLYTNWSDTKMAYGPLWTLIGSYTRIFSGDQGANFFIFKLVTVAFSAGCAVLVYGIVRRLKPGRERLALLLYLWNPLILVETVGSGHNDVVLAFFLLLAVYCAVSGRRLLSFVALALSALVKYVTVVAVPFFLLLYWWQGGKRSERAVFSLKGAFIMVVTAVAVVFPFWGDGFLEGIFQHSQSLGGTLLFGGIANTLAYFIIVILMGSPFDSAAVHSVVSNANAAFLAVALMVLLSVYLYRQKKSYVDCIAMLLLVLFAIAVLSPFFFQPWYYVWGLGLLIVWGAVVRDGRYLTLAALASFAGLFTYTIFSIVSILIGIALFTMERLSGDVKGFFKQLRA
ncbi:MAG: glycosyltransferase 87 family protein [Patescibacteria group bacterium]